MRTVVDFYRARPLVGIIVFCVGLAIAVATVTFQDGDNLLLPIGFALLLGIVVGAIVGVGTRRRGRDRFDFDAAERDAEVEPEPRP